MWTLVALGNPGPEYTATRHNLGRLMLQRWIEDRGLRPKLLRQLPSGRIYGLGDQLQALVPATYMNLSGQAVGEAVALGTSPERLLVLVDDKDLPLGLGRFRSGGKDGGHNGLRSIHAALGSEEVPRLRLGIGPFTRPLHAFVLGEWSEAEWTVIDRLDAPFAAFLDLLAGGADPQALAGKANDRAFWGEGPAAGLSP